MTFTSSVNLHDLMRERLRRKNDNIFSSINCNFCPPIAERLCKQCLMNAVKDESHFFWSVHNMLITEHLNNNTIFASQYYMSKFHWLLSNECESVYKNIACLVKICLSVYIRYYDLISKFQIGLKSLLRQGLSELEFYGDLVYKLKKIVGSNIFQRSSLK